ncbi:MAG: Hsp20/alpha crystallin family protein [Bacilli bacterium]
MTQPNDMQQFHEKVNEVLGEQFVQDLYSILPRRIPAIDMYITQFLAFVIVETPGISSPNDIDITVKNNELTIEGAIPYPYAVTEEVLLRNERVKGSFKRSIQLPFHYEPSTISLSYAHGLFTILFHLTEFEQKLSIIDQK